MTGNAFFKNVVSMHCDAKQELCTLKNDAEMLLSKVTHDQNLNLN